MPLLTLALTVSVPAARAASPEASAAESPIVVVDDTGNSVTFAHPVQRVIALYGAFNEIFLSMGAGDLLVARTAADGNLPELASLPAIGTHMRPNAELVLAQRPDVVLQLAGRSEAQVQTDNLRSLGLNVLTFEVNSFERLFEVTETLGRLAGREERAKALVAAWKQRLEALRARNAGKPAARFFYEVRYPNLLAAGMGGISSEILTLAGGQNVVTDGKKLVRFSEEALLAADPDAYIIQKGPMNPAPTPLTERDHFRDLRAVRQGRVLVVDEERFARPGPRALDAAEELDAWLHR
ncbi:ABC transporter substrate-binding protein [Desulfovibrio desulfuricans]|uniref:ABC transporter substrate-binding protein n=1 Tax=Desulfovibrio desulfuricans TaxID=876 RepID=UPI001FFCCEA6|nr:ABC transporter substrate-binding protein [Desulfovibrio desulfuricans]